jgi:hypothetical protein
MSVAGISSATSPDYSTQAGLNNFQQIQKAFQQLGQDLQSGNLSAAQSDFATLTKLAPKLASSSESSSNPLIQGFGQLSQDLQAGNVTAAQQDYSNIQQAFQHFSPRSGGDRGHHHRHGVTDPILSESSGTSGETASPILTQAPSSSSATATPILTQAPTASTGTTATPILTQAPTDSVDISVNISINV